MPPKLFKIHEPNISDCQITKTTKWRNKWLTAHIHKQWVLGDTSLCSVDPKLQEDGRLWLPIVMDTPLHPVDPKLLSVPSKSILLVTTSPYYKYLQMNHSWPPQKLNGSNSELDPSKPFSLNFCLSLYFTFSSCFIFKLSATYKVQLYPSRDSSFSFRIPC